MTVKECYEQMGADYEDVLGRLRNETLIRKFAKKFLEGWPGKEGRRNGFPCSPYSEGGMSESGI